MAVEIFVEHLKNLYLFERPNLDSRSAGVKVSKTFTRQPISRCEGFKNFHKTADQQV